MINQIHKKFDMRDTSKMLGYVYSVSIPWHSQSSSFWNEACADVVEVFGLPGDRFTSHPKMDQMDFLFKSEKDAQLCKILLSDRF